MVMKKFNDRKEECSSWSSVLPLRVHVKILKHSRESRTLTMIAIENMEYELISASGAYTVKLREYNCACGSWQVSGIPYCHVMAAICHYCGKEAVKDKMTQFVHSSLTKKVLKPPPHTVQPSRPKKQRKREPDEAPKVWRSGTVICKPYHQVGHNKRSCQRRNHKEKCQMDHHLHINQTRIHLLNHKVVYDSDILTSALIPHEHFRFLNLIIPPLMLRFDVELDVHSISVHDVGCVSRMLFLEINNLLDVASLIFELLWMLMVQ
ncbi:hypothetical protein Ddye_029027 [Dipteronia dyeriana]|uniref:SWIM-type domain-containing protein n=1 Tax=Dipteronia dyeriana TaxID=168575 RepID=A0AAD9TDL9_9ROSI|nr:hypothetical protein Ddye_029027 [Dipteronia dyeriana]